MSDQDRSGISITLKGDGAGPWIVFHGDDLEGALGEVEKLNLDKGAMKLVADTAVGFFSSCQTAKGVTTSQNSQAQASAPAAADGPRCKACGGLAEYKEKDEGYAWRGNFCTANKDHVDWLPKRRR